jgi:hypothetical protein
VHAVAPHLQSLEQQNAELQRRLAREARHRLDAAVERAIPNYRELDRDSLWHRWLLGIDALSGQVRQQLLNAAIRDSDAARVKVTAVVVDAFLRQIIRHPPLPCGPGSACDGKIRT